MKPDEMMAELQRRKKNFIFDDETIELCFKIIKDHPNVTEKARAAVILSGIVKKGLGKKTKEFLNEKKDLDPRVRQILSNSIMRMEGF